MIFELLFLTVDSRWRVSKYVRIWNLCDYNILNFKSDEFYASNFFNRSKFFRSNIENWFKKIERNNEIVNFCNFYLLQFLIYLLCPKSWILAI